MFNCNIKYNDTNVNIEFPCTNLTLFAKLADLHVPDEEKSKMDIYIEEVSYEPLKCLEGKSHDPDAINLLAKKLCSFSSEELNKFEAVRELNGITDLYDMINLTDNMHYHTLVKDMSDIKAVGKLRIMTRDGGISAEDINNIDFEAIGKKLIESGNGRITRYGNIYTNSDLEYYEPCTRESLPPFQFYDNQPVCVEISYQGNKNYVNLPDTRMALERAAFRMGARDVSQCKCIIDNTGFSVARSEELNSVEMQYNKLQSILESICPNEGIDKLNMVVNKLVQLDDTKLTYIVPVIEYAEDSSILYCLIALVIALAIALPLSKVFAGNDYYERNIYKYALCFGNFSFMGNAIVPAILDDAMLYNYMLYILPLNVAVYTWGLIILIPRGEKKQSVFKNLINPIFDSILIGAILGLINAKSYIPAFLTATISNCAACMGPLAMILTGFVVGGCDFVGLLKKGRIYIATFLRLFVLPALFVGILWLLGADRNTLILTLFAFGTPLGLNTVVFPAAYGGDTSTGASMALISSSLCIVTIPLMYALLTSLI